MTVGSSHRVLICARPLYTDGHAKSTHTSEVHIVIILDLHMRNRSWELLSCLPLAF
jgi:hypothetical protein